MRFGTTLATLALLTSEAVGIVRLDYDRRPSRWLNMTEHSFVLTMKTLNALTEHNMLTAASVNDLRRAMQELDDICGEEEIGDTEHLDRLACAGDLGAILEVLWTSSDFDHRPSVLKDVSREHYEKTHSLIGRMLRLRSVSDRIAGHASDATTDIYMIDGEERSRQTTTANELHSYFAESIGKANETLQSMCFQGELPPQACSEVLEGCNPDALVVNLHGITFDYEGRPPDWAPLSEALHADLVFVLDEISLSSQNFVESRLNSRKARRKLQAMCNTGAIPAGDECRSFGDSLPAPASSPATFPFPENFFDSPVPGAWSGTPTATYEEYRHLLRSHNLDSHALDIVSSERERLREQMRVLNETLGQLEFAENALFKTRAEARLKLMGMCEDGRVPQGAVSLCGQPQPALHSMRPPDVGRWNART